MNSLAWLGAYRTAIEGVVLAALLGVLAVLCIRLHEEREGRANDRASFSEQRLLANRAAAADMERDRAEEQRRAAAIQEEIDEKDKQLARERADRVIADAASGRLLERYNAYVAAARRAAAGNPEPPSSSASAPADDLPADMFRRLLEVARQYRDVTEDAMTAGELAERAYDVMTNRQAD